MAIDAHRLIVQIEISGEPPVVLIAEAGSYTITGSVVNWGLGFGIPSGSLSVSGTSVGLNTNLKVSSGSFGLTGSEAYLEARSVIEIICDSGGYSISDSGASAETSLNTSTGVCSISGNDLSFKIELLGLPGTYSLTIKPLGRLHAAPDLFTIASSGASLGEAIIASSGAFSLTCISVPRLYGMAAAFTVTGTDAQLTDESAVPWLPGWRYRHRIVIDGDAIPEELTHFPVPIPITGSAGKTDKDLTSIFEIMGVDGTNKKKIAVTEEDGTTQLYVDVWGWCLEKENIGHNLKAYETYIFASSQHSTYPGGTDSYSRAWQAFNRAILEPYGWRSDDNGAQLDGSCWWKLNYLQDFGFRKVRFYAIMEHDYDSLNSFPKDIGIFVSRTGSFTGEETHIGDYTCTPPADGLQPCDWIDFGHEVRSVWIKFEIYTQQNVPNHVPSNWVGFACVEFYERYEMATLMVSRSDFVLTANANNYLYLYYDPDHVDNTTYVGDIADGDVNQKNVWAPCYLTVWPRIAPWEHDDQSDLDYRHFYDVVGTHYYTSYGQSPTNDAFFEMGRVKMNISGIGNMTQGSYKSGMVDPEKSTYLLTLKFPAGAFPFVAFAANCRILSFWGDYPNDQSWFSLRTTWSGNTIELRITPNFDTVTPRVYATMIPDTIHRVAITWDGSYAEIFRDGELVDRAGPITFPSNPFLTTAFAQPATNTYYYAHNYQLAPGYVLSDGWLKTDGMGNTDQLLTWGDRRDIRELHPGSFKLEFYEKAIIYAPSGSFSVTGTEVTLNKTVYVGTESYSLSGFGADMDIRFDLSIGVINLVGSDAYLEQVFPEGMTADAGALSIVGEAGLDIAMKVAADGYSTEGEIALFSHNFNITPEPLNITWFDLPRIVAESAHYTLTGFEVVAKQIEKVIAESGDFDLDFVKILRLYTDDGSFGISGSPVEFFWSVSVVAETGSLSVTGNDARFNWLPAFSAHFNLAFPDIRFQVSVNEIPGIANYIFTLTGAENETTDIEIPISSLQATLRSGSATHLRVIVPGVSQATNIIERKDGRMLIDLVYRQMGGSIIHRETIIEANLEDIRYDEKFNNKFIGLVGYKQKTFVKKSIVLQEPSVMRSINQAHQHYEFPNINVYLKPGDEVIIGEDVFDVQKIDFFINSDNAKMEVFAA